MASRFSARWHNWPYFLSLPAVVKTPMTLCGVLGLFLTLFTTASYIVLQPLVPLFYTLALPSQHLAPKEWLFLFPVLSVMMTVLHILLLKKFRYYDPLILWLFSWTTFGLQMVLTLAVIRSVLIVW
ncbi:MAG TPA: hypothetical protein VD999_04885 [Vitreimonas sp.]|nr:hypothetical protein [Vitreimonas sp.]